MKGQKHSKLGENLFPLQLRWEEPTVTANKPNHVLPAIKLNATYFKPNKEKTLFFLTWGSKQPSLDANKPKHFPGNTERQMCSVLTKEEEKVVLRRRILEQRNLAKHK